MQTMPTRGAAQPLQNSPTIQPSPISAENMAAAILNPPLGEVMDFNLRIGLRYAGQLAFSWPKGWWWALTTEYPKPVSDEELVFLFTRTAMARAVVPQLDKSDESSFAPFLKNEPGISYWKADFSGLAGLPLLPGCYAAPTVTLIEVSAQGDAKILAIKINDLVVTPGDGHAWELTKYFVMQGLSQHMVTCHHIPIHFPNDAINASMKRFLPETHPIRRLLTPHFRFSLPLSNSALHSQASVLYQHQVFPYTGYAFTGDGILQLVQKGFGGIPGNSAYRRYSFNARAHEDVVGDYGKFLGLYHCVIRKWVGQVVEHVDVNEPQLRGWLDECAQWVLGFPGSDLVTERSQLADIVSYVLLNISVMHAAEHYDIGVYDVAKLPHRLRIPPPASRDIPAFDRSKLATKLDAFKHWMSWNMFYREVTETKFIDVRYGFAEADLQAAEERYKRELRELDATMTIRKTMPLERISASIQF
jgi:hypothetical protein